MDKNKFLEEIKDNTLDELEYIYETQKDLYSEEEMKIIEEKIEQFKREERERIEKMLPKEIECTKCFGMNAFENDYCTYCNAKLDKQKYYSAEYYETLEDENNSDEESESYTFQYIISFLIPLIGFIVGAIMMTKDNKEKVSVGKKCIVIGIFSIIIFTIIIMTMINK